MQGLREKGHMLEGDLAYTYEKSIEKAMAYNLAIELQSLTDWAKKHHESCLLEIELYDEHSLLHTFNVVTYMGKKNHRYELHLGFLPAGQYKLILKNRPVSVCEQAPIYLHQMEWIALTQSNKQALIYEHLPLIYGRNHFSEYDQCFTDTPLAMLYRYEEERDVIMIEYHLIFSHEDEGTPGKLLFAKWGRLTDIEWCYRVRLNKHTNEVIERVYQGPEHETRDFTGQFIQQSNRPILQVRTTNGNSDHVIDSTYCFSLVPAIEWRAAEEPREFFMKEYDYINEVMIKEAKRQLLDHHEEVNRVSHPTNYLYCFVYGVVGEDSGVIDFIYENEAGEVTSSYSYKEEIYGLGTFTGEEAHFTIAIEADQEAIAKMRVRLLTGKEMTIKKITLHKMDIDGRLTSICETKQPIVLTSECDERKLEEFMK